MPDQHLTKHEIVALGKQIYSERLKSELERDHLGKFVAIDVLTGEFEIAEEDLDASLRMLERRPGAQLFGIRIGQAAAYRFGIVRCA